MMRCSLCQLGLRDSDEWLVHVEELHDEMQVDCQLCSLRLPGALHRSHLDDVHRLDCPQCPFSSMDAESLLEHVTRHSSPLLCPVCDGIFHQLDELTAHTETHFSSPSSSPSPSSSLASNRMENSSSPLSERIRLLCAASGGTRSVLVARHLTFYGIEAGDQGFGCGFRNLQMLISSLLQVPLMRQTMNLNTIPSVNQLQSLIERAWQRGFDPQGARQLGGRLQGTRKWIGPSEVGVFLQDHGIRVEIVDVEHPDRGNFHPRMFAWIRDYFHQNDYPIYIQHQGHSQLVNLVAGHSQLIIGVEETINDDHRLLIFDPAMEHERIRSLLETTSPEAIAFLRRPIGHMRKPKYQLLIIRGRLENDEDRHKALTYNTTFNHSQIL